jgi:hypothetical protein
MQNWNLTMVNRADRSRELKEISQVTQAGATLTMVLFGSSQAATLWTVFFVVALGTLVASQLKQPLEESQKILRQISLEGSALLTDSGANQQRTTLLNWISTVVRRTDLMASVFTGRRGEDSDLTADVIANLRVSQEMEAEKNRTPEMREMVRRSQQSLAAAVEAARLAEQAISKLGTEISAEDISDLHEVVSSINEQSKWLYDRSSWMDEPELANY